MSGADDETTVTLRALDGRPLGDPAVHGIVVATAHAIAERQGIRVASIDSGDDHVTVTLGAGRIEALGFAAELRRLTGRWYAEKHGGELWGASGDGPATTP